MRKGNGHTFATAPLDALYQTRPGRGLDAPMEAMLMIAPPPRCSKAGTQAGIEWKTDLTLTVKTLSNSASDTSAVG